jgi:hypothetical protein
LISSKNYQSSFVTLTDQDSGFVVRIDQDLGLYLNKPDADRTIKNWFIKSFELLEELINSIKEDALI